MKYDAIVVGAGPAGLVAGRVISDKGFKVAILEKEKQLGLKPCGEAISSHTLNDAMVKPSGDFIAQDIKRAVIYSPSHKKVCIEGGAAVGYILNKTIFLQHLAEKAAESGADIYMNQPVIDLSRDNSLIKVKTTKDEFSASLILGGQM